MAGSARVEGDARPARGLLVSPLAAVEFLTVVRLRRASAAKQPQLAQAQLWYPAVGLGIGLLIAGLDRLLHPHLPPLTEAALLLLALEGCTGFLHLDALADCADGLLCVADRTRRLEIMRDSRAGAFAITAVCLYLLLTWSALGELAGPARSAVLILTPVAGRFALVAVSAAFPYARPSGMGSGFREAARGPAGAVALVVAISIAVLALGPGGLLLLGAATLAALAVGAFAGARLGGVTGDVIGSGCQVAQATALVVAVSLQGAAWFRPWL